MQQQNICNQLKRRAFFRKVKRAIPFECQPRRLKGDVLAEHRVAMLEQCCSYSKQCRDNVITLCCNITLIQL